MTSEFRHHDWQLLALCIIALLLRNRMGKVSQAIPYGKFALPTRLTYQGNIAMVEQGFAGTWQLNRERSDIPPVTKSQVLVIETDGISVKIREILVNDKSETLTISFNGKFDGHDYPVSGTQFADTASYRLLAPNTIEGVAKKNGIVVVKETAVLSDDSKTVRVTYMSVDGKGNSLTSHGVFERVEAR